MSNDNQLVIIGNLTDDPELRYTPNGVPVCNFRIAINRRKKVGDQWEDGEPSYFTVNAWRDYAEHISESLRKGDRVLVQGRLSSRSYEDKEGQVRWVTEIEADEVCPSLRWATAKISKGEKGGKAARSSGPPSLPPDDDDVPF